MNTCEHCRVRHRVGLHLRRPLPGNLFKVVSFIIIVIIIIIINFFIMIIIIIITIIVVIVIIIIAIIPEKPTRVRACVRSRPPPSFPPCCGFGLRLTAQPSASSSPPSCPVLK